MDALARRIFLPLVIGVVGASYLAPARAQACPITITDFTIEGRSETATAYGLTLGNASGGSFAARFEVNASGGKTSELVLPAVDNGPSVQTIFGWPSGDLVTARVKDYQRGGVGRSLMCSGAVVKIQDLAKSPTTLVFAKGTLPVSKYLRPVDPSEPTAPEFVHKEEATYPPEAQNAGIGGAVDVLVDVTATGKATNAVVESSSQFPLLDESAVDATLASTYRPPTINDRPASRRYRVPYYFQIKGAHSGTTAKTQCHVHITHGWLIGLDRANGENLYEIGLSADRNDISAVDVTLEKGDAAPPASFSQLAWRKEKDGSFGSAAYELVGGDLASSARLESVDLRRPPETLRCEPYTIITWDHTSGILETGTRPTLPPANSTLPPIQVVLPAIFERRVWPSYPQNFEHEYVEGSITLIVQVDTNGKASDADVYRSSGDDGLDAAAVKAALQSTYKRTGTAATYVSWYVFRPTLTIGAFMR